MAPPESPSSSDREPEYSILRSFHACRRDVPILSHRDQYMDWRETLLHRLSLAYPHLASYLRGTLDLGETVGVHEDRALCLLIFQKIHIKFNTHMRTITTSKHAWKNLAENLSLASSTAYATHIYEQLMDFARLVTRTHTLNPGFQTWSSVLCLRVHSPNEEVFDTVSRAKTLYHTLLEAGIPCPESFVVERVVTAMGSDFHPLLAQLDRDSITLDKLPLFIQKHCDQLHRSRNQQEAASYKKQIEHMKSQQAGPRQLGAMLNYPHDLPPTFQKDTRKQHQH